MTTRRQFTLHLIPAAITLAALRDAGAQPARVEESDPAAVALGYRHDASKVDPKKYPAWKPGRNCANCQLYLAKGNEPWAPCPALGNKLVAAQGWCNAWVKKA